MKKIIIILAASLGSAYAGFKFGESTTRKKLEALMDSELESVKKFYESKMLNIKEEDDPAEPVKEEIKNEPLDIKSPVLEDKEIKKGKKQRIDYGAQYRTESTDKRIPGDPPVALRDEAEVVDTTKPHIITPEEFAQAHQETVTLFYTADKVLTDDDYNQLDNIGIVGGHPILDQMGIYDADCLYVLDKKKGVVYEVLLEERTFDKLSPLGVISE